MDSELLAEARDHTELFVDGVYEAATDNEQSDVSEFSSKDGCVTDPDEFAAAGADTPLAALLHWSVASLAHGRGGLEAVRDIISAEENNTTHA